MKTLVLEVVLKEENLKDAFSGILPLSDGLLSMTVSRAVAVLGLMRPQEFSRGIGCQPVPEFPARPS